MIGEAGLQGASRISARRINLPKKPIRVLHLITTLDAGGAEVMLLRLLDALDPNLFSSRVVCMAGNGAIGEQIASTGVPVDYLNFTGKKVSFPGILKWVKLLRRDRPEIIQAWMYHANLFGLLASIGGGNFRTIWNIQASGRHPADFKPLTRVVIRACRRLSGFPEAVIVNSRKGVADHIRMGYRRRNLHFIPNGFDLSLYRPAEPGARRQVKQSLGIAEDTPCVGMFARFHPVKDHTCALKAARLILESGINARFIFAGAGVDSNNTALSRRVSSLGLQSRVHLLGYRQDVPQLMAAMDVILSCSHSEGLSNIIGEAMASGVPCVVTDVGDSSRVAGDAGKTVRPRDPEALAEAIMEILRMPTQERLELGVRARERIRTHYAIEKVADAYAQIYLKTIRQKQRDRAGEIP